MQFHTKKCKKYQFFKFLLHKHCIFKIKIQSFSSHRIPCIYYITRLTIFNNYHPHDILSGDRYINICKLIPLSMSHSFLRISTYHHQRTRWWTFDSSHWVHFQLIHLISHINVEFCINFVSQFFHRFNVSRNSYRYINYFFLVYAVRNLA